MKRQNILSKYYPECDGLLEMFKSQSPTLSAKTEDLLDALALAVIGEIGLITGFHSIPKCPSVDAKGIKMQIVGADLMVLPTQIELKNLNLVMQPCFIDAISSQIKVKKVKPCRLMQFLWIIYLKHLI